MAQVGKVLHGLGLFFLLAQLPHLAPEGLIVFARSHLDRLPMHLREKVMPLCEKLGHFARLQGRLVRIAQDAVDQLQLDIKYLLFDLESTRRERDEYHAQLEEILREEE